MESQSTSLPGAPAMLIRKSEPDHPHIEVDTRAACLFGSLDIFLTCDKRCWLAPFC
jgi:hypothetical protein